MANAKRDGNRVPTLIAVSSSNGLTPIILEADETTHELLVKASISGATSIFSKYATNAIDDYSVASTTFIGKESSSGEYIILKIDETGNFPLLTYATIINNPTLTTYALAWAGRTTATYDIYSVAT